MSTKPTTDDGDARSVPNSPEPIVGAAGPVPAGDSGVRTETIHLRIERSILDARLCRTERSLAERTREVEMVRDRYERVLERRSRERANRPSDESRSANGSRSLLDRVGAIIGGGRRFVKQYC